MDHPSDATEPAFSGHLIDDPTLGCAIGTAVHFEPLVIRPVATEGVQGVNNWSAFEGTVLAVVLRDKNGDRVAGSASMIAPGIAVTAWHVLSGEMDNLLSGDGASILFGPSSHGMTAWRPHQIVQIPRSDVALISLKAASPFPPNKSYRHISFREHAPTIGERVMICGFRLATYSVTETNVAFGGQAYASSGVVTQVFPEGRDRVMLPLPCVEVACASLNAMSGGPAFNDAGELIGIVSTGFDGVGKMGPTYVSTLGQIMKTHIQPAFPANAFKSAVTIPDYFKRMQTPGIID